jgi:hypothetical protein
LTDIQRDGAFTAVTVFFLLPVAFFFGRTTFISSGVADELDERWPDGGNEDVDVRLLGARLFVEDENRWGR